MGITKSSRLLKRKEYLFEEQSGLCFYCVNLMLPPAKGNGVRGRRSTPLKASTLEHLTRVVDHGTRERANTVLACHECNRDRGDKHWSEWKRNREEFYGVRTMSEIRLLSNTQKVKELTEELITTDDNVIPFPKLITGGKGPNDPYWLMDLEVGAVFLARLKNDQQNFILQEFALYEKYHTGAVLYMVTQNGVQPLSVHMRTFSNKWEWIETIKIIPQEQLGKPVPSTTPLPEPTDVVHE
jgi:hypothetical protein